MWSKDQIKEFNTLPWQMTQPHKYPRRQDYRNYSSENERRSPMTCWTCTKEGQGITRKEDQ